MTAGRNIELLRQQIEAFSPLMVSVAEKEKAKEIEALLPAASRTEIVWGQAGNEQVASLEDADMVVSAIVGAAGLEPTLAAIEAGRDVALANKETLVIAGELVMAAVARSGCRLFPVDSEHSAIFQSLEGHRKSDVRRLIPWTS